MDLFGSLPKEYCMYFYALSLAGFVLVCLVGVSLLLEFNAKRKFDIWDLIKYVILSLGYVLYYLQNRLLYNMCKNSL